MSSHGSVSFEHDIQVAHRLYRQPGKCQKIHGHSMHVVLYLTVRFDIDPDGYATDANGELLEFGAVKKTFRKYLDDTYDHQLLLNKDDPWAQDLVFMGDAHFQTGVGTVSASSARTLPGLVPCPGDPSTENLAGWIAQDLANHMHCDVVVELQETKTNGVQRAAEYTKAPFQPDMRGGGM